MSSTIPIPIIEIGSRAISPAPLNSQAPGVRRIAAYGFGTPGSLERLLEAPCPSSRADVAGLRGSPGDGRPL